MHTVAPSAPAQDFALIVSLGHDACASISHFVPDEDLRIRRFYVDLEGSMALPEDGQYALLECAAEAHPSVLRAAAQATLAQLPAAWLHEAHIVILVADLSTAAGRHAALVWAQAMQTLKAPAFVVAITPKHLRGVECMQAARAAVQQVRALCPCMLVIDGARLAALTEVAPYVHHACNTLSQTTNPYGHVNVDVDDMQSVLSVGHSYMGFGLAEPGDDMATDVMEDALRGPLLSAHELHQASAVLVLLQASRGTLRLSQSRAIMQQITRRVSTEAHVIYAAGYSEKWGTAVGLTVIAAL